MKTALPLACLMLIGTAGVQAQSADLINMRNSQMDISAEAIRADITTLASPEFEGRAPGGVGEEMTVNFIAGQFAEAGIRPGIDGSFYQPFALDAFSPEGRGAFAVEGPDGAVPFELTEDYILYAGQPETSLSIENSRIVLGGFGIRADEADWDDYDGVDLTGATVILFRGDPGTATGDEDLFGGNALSVHGLMSSKNKLAAELGARAVFLVHTTDSAGYPWETLSSGGASGAQYFLEDDDADLTLFAHISEPAARRLMEAAGLDYDAVYAVAAEPGFTAIETDLTVDGRHAGSITTTMTRNVVGMIEGSGAPDECIVYSAHWDHMGINPDAPTDDHLFNGALDNATGTAMLINIARAYGRLEEAPRRSVYFFATAAEERGLFGAEYFAAHPPCALPQIVGVLNMDAHFPYSDQWDLMVVPGLGTNELMVELEPVAARFGRVLIDDSNPQAGGFYRSDHYPFIEVGVPGLYAVGAPTPEQAEADPQINEGFAWYMANGYHHAADEIDQPFTWRLGGLTDDARIYFELGWRLANSDRWPNFTKGTPWRALRDEMRPE
ncbi:M28 family peptidase [Hyphobacterium sp. HN65]|uniref:M28 family peptidase n=1 Tax=Hyphobacterium lacteum TaxID=3116575 RepID=A0ABU7LQF6_9PROT|nr:M28 family peptidase [Hyphobacterium sp. HN65]MEE2526137.1 M28 family peptidase [Hyphobacterium sp. HN65]